MAAAAELFDDVLQQVVVVGGDLQNCLAENTAGWPNPQIIEHHVGVGEENNRAVCGGFGQVIFGLTGFLVLFAIDIGRGALREGAFEAAGEFDGQGMLFVA